MMYGLKTPDEINYEINVCAIANLYLNGYRVQDLAEHNSTSRLSISAKLRYVFLRLSERYGIELAQPIILARLRLEYDDWMDALSEYEDYLRDKLLVAGIVK